MSGNYFGFISAILGGIICNFILCKLFRVENMPVEWSGVVAAIFFVVPMFVIGFLLQ